jgi:plasmid replication initiation protein
MEEFTIHLTREYVVRIKAKNEEDAMTFSELYVSGGFDDSDELTQQRHNFKIQHIKPIINESFRLD